MSQEQQACTMILYLPYDVSEEQVERVVFVMNKSGSVKHPERSHLHVLRTQKYVRRTGTFEQTSATNNHDVVLTIAKQKEL